jgi:hypothetical protein
MGKKAIIAGYLLVFLCLLPFFLQSNAASDEQYDFCNGQNHNNISSDKIGEGNKFREECCVPNDSIDSGIKGQGLSRCQGTGTVIEDEYTNSQEDTYLESCNDTITREKLLDQNTCAVALRSSHSDISCPYSRANGMKDDFTCRVKVNWNWDWGTRNRQTYCCRPDATPTPSPRPTNTNTPTPQNTTTPSLSQVPNDEEEEADEDSEVSAYQTITSCLGPNSKGYAVWEHTPGATAYNFEIYREEEEVAEGIRRISEIDESATVSIEGGDDIEDVVQEKIIETNPGSDNDFFQVQNEAGSTTTHLVLRIDVNSSYVDKEYGWKVEPIQRGMQYDLSDRQSFDPEDCSDESVPSSGDPGSGGGSGNGGSSGSDGSSGSGVGNGDDSYYEDNEPDSYEVNSCSSLQDREDDDSFLSYVLVRTGMEEDETCELDDVLNSIIETLQSI